MAEPWSKVDKRKGNAEIKTGKKMLKETEPCCSAYFLSVGLWENSWVFTLARIPGSLTRDCLVHFEVGHEITHSVSPSPSHPSIKMFPTTGGSHSGILHIQHRHCLTWELVTSACSPPLRPSPPRSETLGRPRQG